METTSKSTDLLTRLRNVTLEDELKLTDFWPTDNSNAETSLGSSFKTDSFSSYKPSWENTDLNLRSGTRTESGQKLDFLSKSKSEKAETKSTIEEYSATSLSSSDPVENRENPFAKISRKDSRFTSKLSPKMRSWLTNTSCFGILGLICGGSLTAWSLLAKSGSHSMTAMGLSLTISGLLMLVLAGICQTAIRTSGQT